MFIRADDGRYYNLFVMTEVEFRQRHDGAWQLVGRVIGSPIPIVLADNIPNVEYAKAQLEQYVYHFIPAEWLRPKKEPAGKEA